MKVTAPYRIPSALVVSFLALFSTPIGSLARVSGTSRSPTKPRHQRRLRELSSRFRRELRSLPQGATGLNSISLVPRATERIHGLLKEGSVNEDGESDPESRALALDALKISVASLFREASMDSEDVRRELRGGLDGGNPVERHLLAESVFLIFLLFIVALAVGNVVSNEDMPVFAGPHYVNGLKGSDFESISPCNQIPMISDETFGYLPIFAGLFEETGFEDFSDASDWLLNFLELDEFIRQADDIEVEDDCGLPGETCNLTSECCGSGDVSSDDMVSCNVRGEDDQRQCVKRDAESAEVGFVVEPFCLMWSEDKKSNSIDTLGFRPLRAWPPVAFVPGVVSLLPLCLGVEGDKNSAKAKECQGCDYHQGFPVGQVNIGPFPFKITAKFDGFAVSWARPGKLAFDPGYEAEIWDGFRNVLLPRIDGMNFWMNLQFEVIPLPLWAWGKTVCETSSSLLDGAKKFVANFFKLTLRMSLFVSIDTTTDDDGSKLAGQIGENIAGKTEVEERRNLGEVQRELEVKDPCVIVTASADILIPMIGTFKFGNIAGGYCTYPADENGNRCSPSGAFFNINQEFKIEGGIAGILASALEGMVGDMDLEPQKAGNSIGVFFNDGDFEGAVLRLEAPVISLFGITVPGSGRPIIHFQYVKGSEIERRRKSILRTRVPGGPWVPACGNLAADICDNDNDAHWAEFGNDPNTQICKNILINPNGGSDKLMYYNRVLTAELKQPKKESDNYLIRPPSDSKFQTPARYDFSSNPDANVFILHMGLNDFGNWVIAVKEISLSLILSEGDEPNIDEEDEYYAITAYNSMSDTAKEICSPPSGWYFPSLQDYIDHLPEDSRNISEHEIERANLWSSQVEDAKNNGLRAYVRIFCKISVLEFVGISLGMIMMNYEDDVDPSKWRVSGQFESSIFGLVFSVSVTSVIDFDRRRYLHLEGQDYHRALARNGLQESNWDVYLDVGCAPDSFCDAIVEFFEDVGEALWNGVQRIGEFFVEDIRKIAAEAIAMVGDWGKAFIGSIVDFANGVKDLFLNGAVGDVLNSERVKAFNEGAKKAVETWSDGKFTLDDITAAGKLILDGLQIAADFIVAGVKDIINAVGDFFKNVGKAISDCFSGAEWDEARHSGWRSPNECECNPEGSTEHVKEKCWCRDEFGCRVKVPQIRNCKKKKLDWAFWEGCKTNCGSWRDMPEKTFKNGEWRYPRFDGRRFDEACREERMAKIAEVEKKHGKMSATGEIVDTNFKSNFNGLRNFSKERTRRRKLEGGSVATVNSVSFRGIQATAGGLLLDDVVAKGHYHGSRLRADNTDMSVVERNLTVNRLDFSSYTNPGNGNGRNLKGDDFLLPFQRSTAEVYLEDQKFDDEDFMARQPTIHPPSISLAGNGVENSPIELSCSGPLANAWSMKLNSAEPQVMRRRRMKETDHLGTFETVIEFPAEATIRHMILNGTIPIIISPGGASEFEEDVFGEARFLLGTEGIGAFMDTNQNNNDALGSEDDIFTRRKTTQRTLPDPADYEWEVDVVMAEPLCDKLLWKFFVTATDRTGTSNQIDLHAYILYGDAAVTDVPTHIQTRCDTSSIDVEDLEYDFELQDMTGFTTFTPSLRTDNCPSPYVHMMQKEDSETNPGTPCTTDYRRVERTWDLEVHIDDVHMSCPIPNSTAFPFIQTYVLGGLIDENGRPATPTFDLRSVNYYLPNEPNAAAATVVSDFFANGIPPSSECGLCANKIERSVFYNHTEDFVCDDSGSNTISVRVVNNVGIEVTKIATALVIDDKPPNVADSSVEVFEDGYILDNIENNTWDNCQIKDYRVVGNATKGILHDDLNLPYYQYSPKWNYYGPDKFSWIAVDWQDNPSAVATVVLDVIPVNDPPYIYESNSTAPFTILASDVDDSELILSANYTKDGRFERDGLPTGFSLSKGICKNVDEDDIVSPGVFPWNSTTPNAFPNGGECSWAVSWAVVGSCRRKIEKGLYNITFSVVDGGGGTAEAQRHSVYVVIPVDDPPVCSASGRAIPFTINAICIAFAVVFAIW